MLDQALVAIAHAGLHARPQTVLADAGFFNLTQIQALTEWRHRPLVPAGRVRANYPGVTRQTPTISRCAMRWPPTRGPRALPAPHADHQPVFAHIKVERGADRFQRRRLPACRSEWRLIAATHNLLKLWRLTRTPLVA